MSEAADQTAAARVLSVRTSAPLYLRLEEIARRDEISVSAAVRQLLARAVRADGFDRRG